MTSVDWSRVEPLLSRLFELPPETRRSWLRDACGADDALFEQVWCDYEGAVGRGGFLASPLDNGETRLEHQPGETIERYRLVRRIGEGGMGIVWLAERRDGEFRQDVALKVVKRGMSTASVVRRFQMERQVLANLRHPHVARLLDGGTTTDGLPYLVMEHVDGSPMGEYSERESLSVDERLRLFIRVCRAVDYAHDQGVVHRDLKPSNVLVDARGEPRLLDFGIAKVLSPDESFEWLELTRTGERLFSPRYASPEQVRPRPETPIGPPTDVYSLGVILYELLAGQPPFGTATTSLHDLEDEICERAPLPPSRVVEPTARSGRPLAGDLDTIVLYALRKEPARRYRSAAALADDLERFLEHKPILARRDTHAYRVAKFVRRHRALVAGTATLIALLVGALAVTLRFYRDSVAAGAEAAWAAYTASLAAAESAVRDERVAAAREHLLDTPFDLRDWEWDHLLARTDRSMRTYRQSYEVHALAPLGDGTLVLSSDSLRRLDLGTGELRELLPIDASRSISSSRDGRFVAAGSTKLDELWILDMQRPEAPLRIEGYGHPLFLSDGRLAVGTGEAWPTAVFDPESGAKLGDVAGPRLSVMSLAASPDGSRLAVAAWESVAVLLDAVTFEPIARLEGHAMCVAAVAFSCDGTRLATGSLDRTLRVWDAENGTLLGSEVHPGGFVEALAYLPDGRLLVAGDGSGVVRCFDAEGRWTPWRGHERGVRGILVETTGPRVFTCSVDGTVREWDPHTFDVPTFRTTEFASGIAWEPNGARFATAGLDGVVRIWHRETFDLAGEALCGGEVVRLAWTSNGIHALDDLARLSKWMPDDRPPRFTGEVTEPAPGLIRFALCPSPGGARLLASSGTSELAVRDLAGADSPPARIRVAAGAVAVFGPDGDHVVVATIDEIRCVGLDEVELWSLPTLSPANALALHPDGRAVVAALEGGRLLALALADGSELAQFENAGGSVWALAFNPTGTRLVTGDESGTIRVWNPDGWRHVCALHGHASRVAGLEFSPDGAALLSTGWEGEARVWDVRESGD